MGYYVDLRPQAETRWTREILIGRLRLAGAAAHPEYGLPHFILPGAVGPLTLIRDPEARDGTWASIRVPTGNPTRETWEQLLAFVTRFGGTLYDDNLGEYVTSDNLDRVVSEHHRLYTKAVEMFGVPPLEDPPAA